MASGLIRKLVLGTAISGSVLMGARELRATPVDWTSAYQNMFADSQMVNYTTTVTLNGQAPSQNMSLIYYMATGANSWAPIAGFDVQAGSTVAQGRVTRDDPTYYGLLTGQNLNTGSVPAGYWDVVFNANGGAPDNNVRYGQINGMIPTFYEAGEHLNNYSEFSISASGLSAFPMNNGSQTGGTINVFANIPESSTCVLTALGLSTLAFPNGTNVIHFRIAVTNLTSFRVEYRDCLTNAAWSSIGHTA